MFNLFITVIVLAILWWGWMEWQDRKQAKELKHLIQQARERALQRVEERDNLRVQQFKAEMLHRQVMTKHVPRPSARQEHAEGRSFTWEGK